MYFDVFSIIFSCIINLIFYMMGVMVYLPTVRFLSSKYVMNLDRSSDYLGFQLSLLLHLYLCRWCLHITPNYIGHEGLHD